MSEAKKRGEKLTPRQEKAIISLLKQPTIADASRDSGVPAATLFRWLNEPAFARAYRAARREQYIHAVSRLQMSASIAASALVNICSDRNAGKTARVAAAKAILEHAAKGTSVEDLETRLDELEAKLEQQRLRAVV